MTRENQNNKPRGLVHRLITQELGYCCPWAFFYAFRRTAMIALRLGVETRSIRKWKARVKAGEVTCEGCPGCMRQAVILHRKKSQ